MNTEEAIAYLNQTLYKKYGYLSAATDVSKAMAIAESLFEFQLTKSNDGMFCATVKEGPGLPKPIVWARKPALAISLAIYESIRARIDDMPDLKKVLY